MSITIYYKGNLKNPEEISSLLAIVKAHAEKNNWTQSIFDTGISVDIPSSETLTFDSQGGKISGFVKYLGGEQDTLEKIFEILKDIKPLFKRLDVDDDFGMWHNYRAKFGTDTLPPFRDLSADEKEELSRWFDLPKGSTSLFGMSQTQAIIMFMVCKDMNDNPQVPLSKEKLLSQIDERITTFSKEMLAGDDVLQFIAVVEMWFLNKLVDKHSRALVYAVGKTNGCTIFAWLMAEIIYGFGGGSLGSRHQKLHRFIDYLIAQGYDFDEPEIFLRVIYSAMEYLGGYRKIG
jgi:hypothetical protein